MLNSNNRRLVSAISLLTVVAAVNGMSAYGADYGSTPKDDRDEPVHVTLFAPAKGDHVGIGGRGWFVDLALAFETSLANTGFSGFQLTGPAAHNNIDPFPGTFSPGVDDRLPGLIVLVSTTTVGAMSCQNIANLFNLTGVTDLSAHGAELWDTWLVGAPLFGVDTPSRIFVAVADDMNGDGIYNDAPAVVPDVNADGRCNARDLRAVGLASNIAQTRFFINP